MPFGLKNAGATYQRAMNLIFHDLLDIMLDVYIDDIVVKLDAFESHLADLHLAFERMKKYGLKMNPSKCAFCVSARKFLGLRHYKIVTLCFTEYLHNSLSNRCNQVCVA